MHQASGPPHGLELQERAAAFQKLIIRYISQIRFGCQTVDCQYPHCWSCRRRLATSPPRRPTLLTARLQAYALATRRDPYAALCHNEPAEAVDILDHADHTAAGSGPAPKDKSSLVQCLLDTPSFTSFERTGLLRPVGPISRVRYGSQDDVRVDLMDFRRRIEQSMQDLKRLFIKPTQLSGSDQQLYNGLSEPKKLEILRDAWCQVCTGSQLDSVDAESLYETEMLLADRLIRALAAQRCHWELIRPERNQNTLFPLLQNLILMMVSESEDFRLRRSRTKLGPTPDMLPAGLNLADANDSPSRPRHDIVKYLYYGCRAPRSVSFYDRSHAEYGPKRTGSQSTELTQQHLLVHLLLLSQSLVVLLRSRWTGATVVQRWDAVGATLECLEQLHDMWQFTGVCPLPERNLFRAALQNQMRDVLRDRHSQDLAVSLLDHAETPNTRHLLSFAFLFENPALVKHFRTLNYASMLGSYRRSRFHDLFINIGPRQIISERGYQYLDEKLKAARARFLTLDVRRDNVIEDAFNQLRGREMRELRRPLKVLIGRTEAGGEIGIDQGGLTQEFFALAAAEAFNEDFGMFTTDTESQRSWFRPLSPVPAYKFELLGLLFSLALYNGAVVPVNFPLALYRRLLGEPLSNPTATISDGWPDLAQSLEFILNWQEKDAQDEVQEIADALSRDYVFSFETPDRPATLPDGYTLAGNSASRGSLLEYDLRLQNAHFKAAHGIEPRREPQGGGEHAQSQAEPPLMVTNANRFQYIRDYVDFLLVDSVSPQYEAFARGFKTLLTPKAMALLNPPLLQRLVEGDHTLNVDELEGVATYENGYFRTHPVIKHFWTTVRSWSSEKQRRLLEFVTASDRVPVTGLSTVAFSVVRNGAVDDLPTSQTCFGKFNLPEYESKEKLERMLDIALEYGQGFGVM